MDFQTAFQNELIVDSFCGGGGASTAIKMATGRDPDVAINHDPEAVTRARSTSPTTRRLRRPIPASSQDTAMNLLLSKDGKLFDFTTPENCTKNLIMHAAFCSAKMNMALNISAEEGFVPLADAKPYGNLLGIKYGQALRTLDPSATRQVQITDLTFSIFDELIPTERLQKMEMKDVIAYRKASEAAREEFLGYLATVQEKYGKVGNDGDYIGALDRAIKIEILPSAKVFKDKMAKIGDNIFGSLATSVLAPIGTGSAISVFIDLSWEKILGVGLAAATYVTQAAITSFIDERAAKRECAISYVLDLDK